MKTPKNIKTQKIKTPKNIKNPKNREMGGVKTVHFSVLWKVKILDEELLECYNVEYNQRAKYLQNKQKGETK